MISGSETISNDQSDYSDEVSQDQSDGMPRQQLEQTPKSWFNPFFQSEGEKKQIHNNESKVSSLNAGWEVWGPIDPMTADYLTAQWDEVEDTMNELSDDLKSEIAAADHLLSKCKLEHDMNRVNIMSEHLIECGVLYKGDLGIERTDEGDIKRQETKAKLLSKCGEYLIECDVIFNKGGLSEIGSKPEEVKNIKVRRLNENKTFDSVRVNDRLERIITNVLEQKLELRMKKPTSRKSKRGLVSTIFDMNPLAIKEKLD